MSINKLISVKNPIVDAMDLLGIDHDKNIPFFTRQAVLAEEEIGSSYQYITKREVLTIKNCIACLPSDAMYIDIAIMGDLGCDCGDLRANFCGGINLPSTYGTANNTFLVVDIGSAAEGGSLRGFCDFSVQNNKMVFANNYDGQFVTVQYLAPEVDCDGFVMIGQNHIQAIKWYIIWMYYFRKFGKNSLEYGQMNKAEEQWYRECAHARAQDAILTESQRAKIVGMFHAPYIGIGLSRGMNTTLGNSYGY
ncbi:hypothetical protein CCP3SC1AL1_350018 [Gammaproteobacteria bacterium]